MLGRSRELLREDGRNRRIEPAKPRAKPWKERDICHRQHRCIASALQISWSNTGRIEAAVGADPSGVRAAAQRCVVWSSLSTLPECMQHLCRVKLNSNS